MVFILCPAVRYGRDKQHLLSASGSHDLRGLAAASSQRVLLCAQVQPLRLAYRAAQKAKRPIGKFLKRADRLGEFLGPILAHLPPNWKADPERLAAFLKAVRNDYRWAVEFRDPRWLCEEVFAVLNEHGSALCIHDMIDDHPRLVTAGWVYLRFHGEHYSGSYSSEKLRAEARWIKQQLAGGKDVFAYFNNDAQGYAVKNAVALRSYVLGSYSTEQER